MLYFRCDRNPATRHFACFQAHSYGIRKPCRGVAQPGRAPGSGPGGRRFKSSLPDQSFSRSPNCPSAFTPSAFSTVSAHSQSSFSHLRSYFLGSARGLLSGAARTLVTDWFRLVGTSRCSVNKNPSPRSSGRGSVAVGTYLSRPCRRLWVRGC